MAKTKKKNKQLMQLGILAVVLVLLVVALLVGQNLNDKAAQAEADALLETIDISYLEGATTLILNDGSNEETYLYDADSESWVWAEDASFPLNNNYITSILNTWSVMSPSSEMEILDDLSAYGLDPAQCSATIVNDEGESMTFLVGNSTGSYYYAMIEGEDTIYLISSSMNSYLHYGLYDMASITTFPATSSDTLVSILVGDVLLTQEITETTTVDDDGEESTESVSTWYLEDGTDISDGDYLSELTSEVIGLGFDALVNYAASEDDLAACGLDDPLCVVVTYSATAEDGETTETATFTLMIGDLTADGSYYYVRLVDGTESGNIEIYEMDFSDISTLLSVASGGAEALYATEAES